MNTRLNSVAWITLITTVATAGLHFLNPCTTFRKMPRDLRDAVADRAIDTLKKGAGTPDIAVPEPQISKAAHRNKCDCGNTKIPKWCTANDIEFAIIYCENRPETANSVTPPATTENTNQKNKILTSELAQIDSDLKRLDAATLQSDTELDQIGISVGYTRMSDMECILLQGKLQGIHSSIYGHAGTARSIKESTAGILAQAGKSEKLNRSCADMQRDVQTLIRRAEVKFLRLTQSLGSALPRTTPPQFTSNLQTEIWSIDRATRDLLNELRGIARNLESLQEKTKD